MEWLGFWIFASVFLACDTWLFSKGYNSIFWDWKNDKELALRDAAVKSQECAK